MQRNLVILFSALIIALTGAVLYLYSSHPKIGYVNLNKVYNDFELKKELDKKLTEVQQFRKNNLDSMELNLKVMSNQIQQLQGKIDKKIFEEQVVEFQTKRQDFLDRQQKFMEDNDAMTSQYMDQIWKQINQFVGDYGKEKGYQSITSGDGTGSVMFASPEIDITTEVAQYINTRYKGN